MIAQLTGPNIKPALFIEIAFENETIWLWSGVGTITPAGPPAGETTFPYGQAFLGMGWLGQISQVPEVTDVVAQNVTLTLSGIPSELLGDAINYVRQNSIATIWLGFLDANNKVIADPTQSFQGHLDVPTVTEGSETCTLSITAENPLVDLNRAPNRRFTDVDQQFKYSGDLGFSAVTALQGLYLGWPLWFEVPGGGVPS
jgi:hypothetical protein